MAETEDHPTPPAYTEPHNEHLVNNSDLSDVDDSRPTWYLTVPEVKLLGIAGVGFFLDAYDLFVINPVATMLQYRLYNGGSLPSGLEGFLKAGANIGSVIGQFAFGFAADYFGRKAVYGKELMLIIFATIMCISDPTGDLSPQGSLIWLAVFRIILGIGVGGDYPMSASVSTDRAHLRRRGTMLAYIFSNQGWGSLIGSLMFIIVLACYHHTMDVDGKTSKVDGVWRIVVGMSLIPAFGTLYQRLTLPEAKRFEESQEGNGASSDLKKENSADVEKSSQPESSTEGRRHAQAIAANKKSHFADFFSCWFLLDIAFYGINLNQNVVLQEIGFDGSSGSPWTRLFKIGIGNLIITALGFVPGYYATIFSIEKLGRKWIQIQGFLMAALFLGILAGKFHSLSNAAFIVNFALLQFFFNFGANATTYCYPAELFPTKFRATAHGVSAAFGKAGAIISALAFNSLSQKIGTPAVLWIFFGCCIAGAVCSLLLPEVRGRDPDVVYAAELRERGT
ncbi:hypothetical protein EUX98_g3238 [Antrodiella citrinella]|uniref:Major facilitator superfamily (MFS) profile domain-containing protein n=1 Tax=Antrodiella citrinella TaxID=2447956 RepID=A0A4S4MWZ0_9APHY|nr:hypothetical protein EUX98_g3238 [Antrodiella citrinella]